MRWSFGAVLAALAGCGRVGFDVPGAGDASSDGTNPDGPPQPLCQTTYQSALLCDDFEGDLSQWFLNLDGPNTIVLDSFARSGSGAAHIRAAQAGAARLIASVLGGATSGTLYIRYYQWLSPGPIESISLVHVVSNVTPYPGIVLDVRNDDEIVVLSTISGADYGPTTVVSLPRSSWTCIQARLDIAANGSVTSSIDGVAAAMYAGNTITSNGYEDFHVGIYLDVGSPVEAWIDDVVADFGPVPCD